MHGWRIVLELTAQQVAERAGITRDTLRRIEKGDSSVGFGNVAQVLRAPGVLEKAVEAIDPLNSDIAACGPATSRGGVRDDDGRGLPLAKTRERLIPASPASWQAGATPHGDTACWKGRSR